MIGRLLLVDDEAWFREGLSKLIGNNQLGWEVVGDASDGEGALAMIEAAMPDLVITDINMPVMDGLELAGKLSALYPDIMVIILTGYRDFEYARQALRYGVTEFLLKPLALDETCRVLQQTYEKLRLKQLDKRLQEKERQASVLQSALLRLPCSSPDMPVYRAAWEGRELWLLKVESFCPPGKAYTDRDVGLLHYAVSNMAEELLQLHLVRGILLPMKSDEYACLLAPGKPAADYRSHVMSAVRELIGLRTVWLEGGVVRQLDEAAALYEQMQNAGKAGSPPEHIRAGQTHQLREELLSMIATGNLQGAGERIESYVKRSSGLGLYECKTEIYTLMTVFSDILMTEFKHLNASSYEDLNPGSILLMSSVKELADWASAKGQDFISLFAGWMQEKQDNVVLRAIRYIETHYRESCTLQTVAAHVHVTPNYLSNLFKKETGVGFTNYVSRLRVEKAKALLSGSRLKMMEIAEQTGFDNASYFTAVFKQLTGRSPSEYRKEQ